MKRWIPFVVVLLATPAVVQAQDARDQALLLFQRAEERFRTEEYEVAILLLREAIELYDAPPLHFNLARALHETDQLEPSRAEYRRFLEMEPNSPREREVQALIGQIDAEIRARDMAEVEPLPEPVVAPPDDVAPPEDAPERSRSVAPWIIAGSAVIPLGVAVVTSVLFNKEVDAARSAPNQQEAEPHVQSADRYSLVANIMYGVGGALALTGVVWGIVSLSSGSSDASDEGVAVRVGPGSVSLTGSF